MNRNYILLTLLMLVLAVGTFMLKTTVEPKQIEPDQLLKEIVQSNRYVTTDQVAQMIIKGDPSLMIIDVRSEEEFQEYALPNAVNVPMTALMDGENMFYFGIPGTKVVFVSNDDILADQTWILTKRLGVGGTYVMKGGLNRWMETIIDPQEPGINDAGDAFATYSFRKGAQIYFTGAGEDTSSEKVKVSVQRRKKTAVAAGGC